MHCATVDFVEKNCFRVLSDTVELMRTENWVLIRPTWIRNRVTNVGSGYEYYAISIGQIPLRYPAS